MAHDVESRRPKRRYNSPLRTQQAAETRRAVLDAARELFTSRGYAATAVAEIAERAGVAVDTVYATVGRKPALLRNLVETALSGQDTEVATDQRDYLRDAVAAPTGRAKLETYVTGLVEVHPRLAPVFLALRDAAGRDEDCARLWSDVATRRATSMRLFAADLRATGELRDDLTDDEVADVIWSMNSPEYWALLVDERGWSPERFGRWLVDAWCRTLLA